MPVRENIIPGEVDISECKNFKSAVMTRTGKSEKPEMKLDIDDFLKEDFYQFFKYLQYAGFWRYYTKNKRARRIHNVYMSYVLGTYFIFFVAELVDAYSVRNDLPKLTENLSVAFVSAICGFKLVYLLRRDDFILDIHNNLTNDLFGIRSDYEQLIKSRNEINRLFRIFASLVLTTMIFMCCLPLIEETRKRTLPIRISFPYVDLNQNPMYEITYVFLCYFLIHLLTFLSSFEPVFYAFFIHIARQFDTMSERVRNLSYGQHKKGKPGDSKEIFYSIKEIVRHHQATLRVINSLADYFGWPLFLQLFLGIMLFSVVSLELMNSAEVSLLTVIYRACFIGSCYFDFLVYCYYGSLLEDKSLQLAKAIYECSWIDMNGSVRKMLMIIANQALKVPTFKTALKVPVNCHTFKNMVRLSYNFAMVFWEIENN